MNDADVMRLVEQWSAGRWNDAAQTQVFVVVRALMAATGNDDLVIDAIAQLVDVIDGARHGS